MMNNLPLCPQCQMLFPGELVNTREVAPCPNCGKELDLRVYPALFRQGPTGSVGEVIMVDGEASCFYHPQKRAAVPCHSCGRFLCSLCDVDLHGKHYCPSCLDSGQKKGNLAELENKRVLWDNAALAMALVPLLLWIFTIFTAPMAIVLGVIAWRKPSSIVPRTRIRIYLTFLFAGVEIVAWVFFGATFFWKRNS